MKKISTGLILLAFLAVLVVPAISSAVGESPQECCRLKRSVNIGEINTTGVVSGLESDGSARATKVVGQPGGACDISTTIDVTTQKWGIYCLINAVQTAVDWVFVFLVVLTVLFVILGAYDILTSAGSPEKITTGRNYILYAAIGLIVAFIARAVPGLVKAIMGF